MTWTTYRDLKIVCKPDHRRAEVFQCMFAWGSLIVWLSTGRSDSSACVKVGVHFIPVGGAHSGWIPRQGKRGSDYFFHQIQWTRSSPPFGYFCLVWFTSPPISFVGEFGFLREQRRTNVAVTRARRHLALVGDSGTISREPFIGGLLKYCSTHGDVCTAYDYINGNYGNCIPCSTTVDVFFVTCMEIHALELGG